MNERTLNEMGIIKKLHVWLRKGATRHLSGAHSNLRVRYAPLKWRLNAYLGNATRINKLAYGR